MMKQAYTFINIVIIIFIITIVITVLLYLVIRSDDVELTIIIIIIIAPLSILSEDVWGDLECLYKACQAARPDGGLFTNTGEHERGKYERQSENDCEIKTVS